MQAPQDLNTPFGIDFLHALLFISFPGGGGGLIPLHFGNIFDVVDVP